MTPRRSVPLDRRRLRPVDDRGPDRRRACAAERSLAPGAVARRRRRATGAIVGHCVTSVGDLDGADGTVRPILGPRADQRRSRTGRARASAARSSRASDGRAPRPRAGRSSSCSATPTYYPRFGFESGARPRHRAAAAVAGRALDGPAPAGLDARPARHDALPGGLRHRLMSMAAACRPGHDAARSRPRLGTAMRPKDHHPPRLDRDRRRRRDAPRRPAVRGRSSRSPRAPGRVPRRAPRAVPGAGRGRPGDRRRAGRARRHRPALRPRVARAAGRRRRSSTSTTSPPRRTRGATRCRPATRRSCSTRRARGSSRRWPASSSARPRRMPRPARGVPDRRRRRLGGLRPGRRRGPGGHQPAAVPRTSSATGSAPCPTSPRDCATATGRVADVACGTGWSSISIARAFPGHRRSTASTSTTARSSGRRRTRPRRASTDRVSFLFADAADAEGAGPLRPGDDLRGASTTWPARPRSSPRPGASSPPAARCSSPTSASPRRSRRPGDEAERLFYGYSVVACLANGLVDQPSVGTGTVLRPAALEAIAREAGFGGFTILPDRARGVPLLPPRPVGGPLRIPCGPSSTKPPLTAPGPVLSSAARSGRLRERPSRTPRPRVHSPEVSLAPSARR